VTSVEDVGSTLTVYLPIVIYHDRGDLHPEIAPGSRAVGVKFKGRILVADDNKRSRSLISSVLGDDLYSIDEVEDGREAVNRLKTHGSQYDLIILDCLMPKLSGSDVYKQIRGSGITVPVLLISGYRQEQVLSDNDRDPAVFFLKKPFGVDELVEQVGNVLRETQSDTI
jgi:CheY-like chemotaxis protein